MNWCNFVDIKKTAIFPKLDRIDDGFCLLFFLKSLEDYGPIFYFIKIQLLNCTIYLPNKVKPIHKNDVKKFFRQDNLDLYPWPGIEHVES